MVAEGGGAARRDPGGPELGSGAHLIAAPLAVPGFVVAVSTGGTVWRRDASGGWSVSLALLPATLITEPGGHLDRRLQHGCGERCRLHRDRRVRTLLTSDGGDDLGARGSRAP